MFERVRILLQLQFEHDPCQLLGGREQFAMADVEDAGVLATAFASRTALLVTGNSNDFRTKDSRRIETRVVNASSGKRQLHALRHQWPEVDLIVAHPLDVISWLERRIDFEPEALWDRMLRETANRSPERPAQRKSTGTQGRRTGHKLVSREAKQNDRYPPWRLLVGMSFNGGPHRPGNSAFQRSK